MTTLYEHTDRDENRLVVSTVKDYFGEDYVVVDTIDPHGEAGAGVYVPRAALVAALARLNGDGAPTGDPGAVNENPLTGSAPQPLADTYGQGDPLEDSLFSLLIDLVAYRDNGTVQAWSCNVDGDGIIDVSITPEAAHRHDCG